MRVKADLEQRIFQCQTRINDFQEMRGIIADANKFKHYIKTKKFVCDFMGGYTERKTIKLDFSQAETLEILDMAIKKEREEIDKYIDELVEQEISKRKAEQNAEQE